MLLSIIIPVYNLENYIGRCLESCIDQSCVETMYEIICVDDGSKDNSAQIIKKYSEHNNRIKYIHKENGGVSSARNLGLTKASGEYVWFVDGDDWIRKDSIRAIGNIVASISEKPDSVLFDSKIVYEYENQQIDSEPGYKMGGGGTAPFQNHIQIVYGVDGSENVH